MTEITFTNDKIAEVVIDPVVNPISADELVHVMLEHGVTAAKIIRTTQTEEESPLSRFVTQQESGRGSPKHKD